MVYWEIIEEWEKYDGAISIIKTGSEIIETEKLVMKNLFLGLLSKDLESFKKGSNI